ncbi:MAG TPA: hypothetical protein VFU47_16020, partial [Armatimonadota bacterium]|nr:hypothetical protein [Armatimonadota bacterium]
LACARAKVPYQEGPLLAQRGSYVAGHALDRTFELKGEYLDLFHPDLPLVENPRLPYRLPALYKQVRLITRIPVLLHASHRCRVLEGTVARLRLLLDGPAGSTGTARVYPAGMSLAGVDAVDSQGQRVNVEVRIEGRTLRVRYPQSPDGLTVTLRWIRPEARLTK